MYRLIAIFTLIALAGCSNMDTMQTDKRPMNAGETTLVSDQVLAMVDANGGSLDTREHNEVKCKRVKIVGTHIHRRFCYTTEEERQMAEETADRYYARFGLPKCLDGASVACQAGLEAPLGGAGGIR